MAGCMVEDRYPRITFDRFNRMKFHPDFHPNQGKPYTTEELEYLCRFYDHNPNDSICTWSNRTSDSMMMR